MTKDEYLEIRDSLEGKLAQRILDIRFGIITPFEFSRTHRKLELARQEAKIRDGLKPKGHGRLSHKISMTKHVSPYFTPYYKTVRGKIYGKRFWRKPFKKTVEYGRRQELIIDPRVELHIKKYGYLGG